MMINKNAIATRAISKRDGLEALLAEVTEFAEGTGPKVGEGVGEGAFGVGKAEVSVEVEGMVMV